MEEGIEEKLETSIIGGRIEKDYASLSPFFFV